ncbi:MULTISPECIES: HK97-gp10 family putative phage morphogenesis protein [unclassified Streptomyces]|uniref:HK97-gp10 family putative phage morphogenesis protein n=1 Tax=unclassified Streptomyces TaxID=2593676 RepID=UPI00226F501D|nr:MULTISPECIES: HK97-gp10 family putative phage morphogenesis protein [unclassified Streptomyces]MCY0919605.1 HK97 gp10 family phage protein [Streptomyces sp. H27-G5]MCY0957213.1 HK97 gp10 family phage protein [Streptomyces sp. H27-H5]
MPVRVQIQGAARLRVELDQLDDTVIAALKKGVREAAEAVRDDTKMNVPRDTGHLHDHVDIRYEDDGLTAEIGWFDEASYYAKFWEHGTRRRPARPSLGPALEAERHRYRARLTEEVKRVLR